jgi:hypothetical protein
LTGGTKRVLCGCNLNGLTRQMLFRACQSGKWLSRGALCWLVLSLCMLSAASPSNARSEYPRIRERLPTRQGALAVYELGADDEVRFNGRVVVKASSLDQSFLLVVGNRMRIGGSDIYLLIGGGDDYCPRHVFVEVTAGGVAKASYPFGTCAHGTKTSVRGQEIHVEMWTRSGALRTYRLREKQRPQQKYERAVYTYARGAIRGPVRRSAVPAAYFTD